MRRIKNLGNVAQSKEVIMKRLSMLLSVMALALLVVSALGDLRAAEELATREECLEKTKQAAKLIEEIGLEAALQKMNDPNGPFMWKDSYVFCLDETGKVLVHKDPKIIGFQAKNLKDVNGKLYMQEIIDVANTKGEGLVSYMYHKTPGAIPEPKTSYILKVPSANVIVGAGFYE
jgi:signal transduction histidine kinase